ncbi:unnamed protein product (macronuclear) [Paramecium tetraurelia]|uniref:HTH psq-type domain-containing protein n=1 Tax=Paramecium tetraurelia TaxID=5888 RepID=A0DW44_PARTE|nr:uncharacterized protein GSPATT00020914001 [Paramecium tetraurelia]CAK87261.1 unnamed protein product [Paramecium tetraurelia]|eukprot:XP_001454658.1 hypothetical protein (macronuclear) [Paramecium tetraurelia strain d4-2]
MAQTQIQQDQKLSLHNAIRQPYQKIGNEIREKVIYDIVFQENSIKQTALKYGLKYSTANGIVQTYQQQGRCMKKDKRNKKQYFKRNKILVIIDLKTGDVNLYQQQTTSNVLILESSIHSNNISNFKQQDQFRHPQECTEQFINQDIESISNNLIFWMKKNMKFRICKNDASSNSFKTHRNMIKSNVTFTQQESKPQIQLNNELMNTEIQKKLKFENINHQKQEISKQKEECINKQQSDQLKHQIQEMQCKEQATFNLEKFNTIQQQLDNILKLWKQQLFLMSQS